MLAGWQRVAPYLGYGSAALYVALVAALSSSMWVFAAEAVRFKSRARPRAARARGDGGLHALDARVGRDGDVRALGRRVCGVVAARSAFGRVAMLARDAEGRLYVAASEGMDDGTVAAVETWAARAGARERAGGVGMSGGVRMGARSLVVPRGETGGRAIVIPLWTGGGRMIEL